MLKSLLKWHTAGAIGRQYACYANAINTFMMIQLLLCYATQCCSYPCLSLFFNDLLKSIAITISDAVW